MTFTNQIDTVKYGQQAKDLFTFNGYRLTISVVTSLHELLIVHRFWRLMESFPLKVPPKSTLCVHSWLSYLKHFKCLTHYMTRCQIVNIP